MFPILGCKKAETSGSQDEKSENEPIKSPGIVISGEIFIVTKGRENIPIGDERIVLLDADKVSNYYGSKAQAWQRDLEVSQNNIQSEIAIYKSLNQSNIDQLITAGKYWNNVMHSSDIGSDDYQNASLWKQKIDLEIEAAYEQNHASSIKQKLDEDIYNASNYWDQIAYPDSFSFPSYCEIASTTSDSEGHFKFSIDQSKIRTDMCLVAKATRETPDGLEKYWWAESVNQYDENKQYILSNNNSDDYTGAIYKFFQDTNVVDWGIRYLTNNNESIDVNLKTDELDEEGKDD